MANRNVDVPPADPVANRERQVGRLGPDDFEKSMVPALFYPLYEWAEHTQRVLLMNGFNLYHPGTSNKIKPALLSKLPRELFEICPMDAADTVSQLLWRVKRYDRPELQIEAALNPVPTQGIATFTTTFNRMVKDLTCSFAGRHDIGVAKSMAWQKLKTTLPHYFMVSPALVGIQDFPDEDQLRHIDGLLKEQQTNRPSNYWGLPNQPVPVASVCYGGAVNAAQQIDPQMDQLINRLEKLEKRDETMNASNSQLQVYQPWTYQSSPQLSTAYVGPSQQNTAAPTVQPTAPPYMQAGSIMPQAYPIPQTYAAVPQPYTAVAQQYQLYPPPVVASTTMTDEERQYEQAKADPLCCSYHIKFGMTAFHCKENCPLWAQHLKVRKQRGMGPPNTGTFTRGTATNRGGYNNQNRGNNNNNNWNRNNGPNNANNWNRNNGPNNYNNWNRGGNQNRGRGQFHYTGNKGNPYQNANSGNAPQSNQGQPQTTRIFNQNPGPSGNDQLPQSVRIRETDLIPDPGNPGFYILPTSSLNSRRGSAI